MPDDPLTSAQLLAAAAIVAVEADERGLPHLLKIADALAAEARRIAPTMEADDD